MWWRQPFANVNPKQCILAQGDVELEELRLAEVHQGSPEHPGRHLLGHAPAHLQAARIYAAVACGPGTWDGEEGIKQKSISHLGCVATAPCLWIQRQLLWKQKTKGNRTNALSLWETLIWWKLKNTNAASWSLLTITSLYPPSKNKAESVSH